MKPQIALLRGINVGGKNILPMRDLIELFYSKGCTGVQTYIQSGNVIFQGAKTWGASEVEDIRKAIADKKGFSPHILIVSERDFHRAIENNPFPKADKNTLHFFFLGSEPKHPNLERLRNMRQASEEFFLVNNIFYLFAPDGIGRSRLAATVESALGVPATARNWNTVEKLISLLRAA